MILTCSADYYRVVGVVVVDKSVENFLSITRNLVAKFSEYKDFEFYFIDLRGVIL